MCAAGTVSPVGQAEGRPGVTLSPVWMAALLPLTGPACLECGLIAWHGWISLLYSRAGPRALAAPTVISQPFSLFLSHTRLCFSAPGHSCPKWSAGRSSGEGDTVSEPLVPGLGRALELSFKWCSDPQLHFRSYSQKACR